MGSQALTANLLWLLSLHRSTGPGRSLLQHKLSTGSQTPSGIHLLQPGVFHGLQVDICSTMDLHGLQGDSLPPMVFIVGCGGKISALASGAPPLPPPSLTLASAELFSLTLFHSSLLTAIPQQVFPFLKYVITEAIPLSLTGLALASIGSVLEPAGTGSVRCRGSFSQLLTEATSIAPLLPKPCHANPEQLSKELTTLCGPLT